MSGSPRISPLPRDLFLLDPAVAFLNHGSFGATPRPVFDDYQAWQRELERQPVEFLFRRFPELMRTARDLVCADNLGRAAAGANVRQIVYLGGLLPLGELSEHLASRLEVEQVLGASGVPVTAIRAGMVIGGSGSSFQILERLVRRLPVMGLPPWADTRMQPIDVADVVALLAFVVDEPRCIGRHFDVGTPEVMTYRGLIELTGELIGKPRKVWRVPIITPGLSRLWVSLITGAPRALVAPLVKSMRHPMVAGSDELARMAGRTMTPIREALAHALAEAKGQGQPRAFQRLPGLRAKRTVRSVQRMQLPPGRDAAWAAAEYVRALPHLMPGLLRAEIDATGIARFYLRGLTRPLLVLERSPQRSRPDRELFYVTGGMLARKTERGRFELRQIAGGRTLIAAIHDFVPALPWFVYRFSQALVHRFVMWRFGRWLARAAPGGP